MKGYTNNNTYLSGNRNTDTHLFFIFVFIIFTLSMSLTVYDVWVNNSPDEWTGKNVDMSTGMIVFLLLGLPAIFYTLQLLRMSILYMKGYEMWIQDYMSEHDFITLCVHPGADLVKSVMIFVSASVGSLLINGVMQANSTTRQDALESGIVNTVVIFIGAVVIPLSIKGMQHIRKKQLEKLATYREVGGKE